MYDNAHLATMPFAQITSKERDAETGLDYFGARYLSSVQGRFTSTDPLNVPNLQFLDNKKFSANYFESQKSERLFIFIKRSH